MGSEGQIQSILVTGGAGFIGTHTVLQLLKEGFRVSIIDNLHNSVEDAVDRVRTLAGLELSRNLRFHLGDLRNKGDLEKVFSEARFDAVIHFAGLKAVGESVAKPLLYYDNNLIGMLNLYECMEKYGCKKMVFSSSSTVYGQPEKIPCVEDFDLKAMNPYGRTKLFLEEIARDIQKVDPEWRIILLRYFNPVAAHESGQIGEDPKGIPNNLMPYIQRVALGRLPVLNVYGYDYPTKDGSAIRDYIHVMDVADGHIAALRKLFVTENMGCVAYNLGTGYGTSVLEMVAAFEKASDKKIPIKLCARRPGDATAVYASTEKAEKELGWKATDGQRLGAMNSGQSAAMAAQICDQIRSVFSSPSPSPAIAALPPALQVLVSNILLISSSASKKVFVHGVGREGLMLKGFCMRLYHLGLSAHVVGDVMTPPITSGDLLIASAGPGHFSTVDAICRVSKTAGARIVLLTAQPRSGDEASLLADEIAYLPAQTMADDDSDGATAAVALTLPLGSLYEGAMFILFEMVVLRLAEELGQTPAMLRSRHTNLE